VRQGVYERGSSVTTDFTDRLTSQGTVRERPLGSLESTAWNFLEFLERAMSEQTHHIYEFGPFRLDAKKRFLLHDGQPVKLFPKEFDTLLALVEESGRDVKKEELMRRIWPDSFVEESNLTTNISHLRKALGENAQQHQYIVRVPGGGYRFVADVKEVGAEKAPELPVEQEEMLVREPSRAAAVAPVWKKVRLTFLAVVVLVMLTVIASYHLWQRRQITSAPSTPTAASHIQSIAVLPFKPLVAVSRDESLEMGMADTLITRLSNIRQVIVRPSTAVRKYTGLEQDAVAAGREQRVDAVLDGSIQKSGDKIRVTVQLLNVRDGSMLWGFQCEEQWTDIFAVQDLVAERVAKALMLKLTGEERELLTKHYTANTEAYQLYLRGRYFLNKSTEEDFRRSIEYFQQALEKDPNYALAYAGLADCYAQLGNYGLIPMKESHPRAREAATRALEIDDKLGEAHASLAFILTNYYWDWAEAEKRFKRAIELNPNYAMAHSWYSQYLSFMGRSDEAIREANRAQEIDPLSLFINSTIGFVLYLARQYDQAIAAAQKTLELDPNFAVAHMIIGLSYVQKKMYEESISELQKAKHNPDSRALLGYAYAVAGKRSEARKILDELDQLSKQKYVASAPVGIIYIGLGEKDQVLQWLEKAYDERLWEVGMLKVAPVFDPLRSDPRFEVLLRRVKLIQ
jgi:DNA-binding winged helix-turn-helix (wHTH) protein/TolB-like protein/Tfp pilus assembly protein PilF